jgi:hypothetical protein
MLLLIFGICLVLFISGFILYEKTNLNDSCGAMIGVGAIVGVIALVTIAVVGISYSVGVTADERITMYQEENTRIEEQIAEIVTQYQQYEKDIFTEVQPDSAMTLISLYPELKSDSLVASQIEIYVKNNEKIKSLKEESINNSVYRWWLYFGN